MRLTEPIVRHPVLGFEGDHLLVGLDGLGEVSALAKLTRAGSELEILDGGPILGGNLRALRRERRANFGPTSIFDAQSFAVVPLRHTFVPGFVRRPGLALTRL